MKYINIDLTICLFIELSHTKVNTMESHQEIGNRLDLFFIDQTSPGCIFWLGTHLEVHCCTIIS